MDAPPVSVGSQPENVGSQPLPTSRRGMQRFADLDVGLLSLWKEGIHIGYDGSILDDGDRVYILGVVDQQKKNPIQKIDYFHGFNTERDIAQLLNKDMGDFVGSSMINMAHGFTVIRIKNIQRRWRKWREKVEIVSPNVLDVMD